MRLRRLDLVRYGKFTDASVDFGPKADRPDLHVVYGPNEAGKSTAFSAFLDLLFGIDETRKPGYGFLHRPQGMRIGAALEMGGGVREVVRLFRQPLLDARERPLPDALVADELGGLTRESYRTMFSLDDDTLEAGGKSIVASAGDLGQLLFSASAGLSAFSRDLAALRAEAEAFYKTGGKSQELGGLKKRLKELKLEKEAVDTLASAYGQLVSRRDRAATSYEAALRERSATKTALDAITRRLGALPLAAELLAARRELDEMPTHAATPAGWEEALPALQVAEVELATRAEAVGEEVERLAADLRAMPEDDGAAVSAPALNGLAHLRPRHVTAITDLPDRRTRLAKETAEVSRLLRQLEAPAGIEPAGLLLPVRVVGRLRALMENRSGIETSLADAITEAAAAERQVVEMIEGHPASDPDFDATASTAHLSTAIALAEGGDHKARARLAERSLPNARDLVQTRLAGLEPWVGSASELARMPFLGTAELARLDGALAQAGSAIASHRAELDRVRAEILRAEAAVESIRTIGGPPDDEQAAAARRRRDALWNVHRGRMDDASADAFETAMRADDDVGAGQLASFADVVALREGRRSLVALRAEETIAEHALSQAVEAHRTLAERRRDLLSAASPLLTSLTPDRFEAWLSKRLRALDAIASMTTLEDDLKAAINDEDAARASLSRMLASIGVRHDGTAGLAGLLDVARAELGRLQSAAAAATALAQARSGLELRRVRLRDAQAAEAAWTDSWAAAMDGTWLASHPALEVGVVREVLTLLSELGPAIERRDELDDRVGKMEASQASFSAAVEALAGEMGVASAGRDAIEVADILAERIDRSRSALAARSTKAEDLAEAETRRIETLASMETHGRRKAEMTGLYAVETLAEVAGAIASSRRREMLRARCAVLEASIVTELDASSVEGALAELGTMDRSALEGTRNELGPRYEDQDQGVRELYVNYRAAVDALDAVGGDDAPSRFEEQKRTLMLEIEDKAMRYLALRAGILATEEALHLYREKHRSEMMDHAATAFRTISGGAYTGLAAQALKDGETLVGKMAGGGSKLSTDMSKGTRFQLYLALRVAGYHEFVRSRAAVPFVADDIMETFDDARAEQAFRLLSQMAEAGQVIYLTHHRHLCDIVGRACPSVTIHELGGMIGSADPGERVV